MLSARNDCIEGKTCVVSGSGNVAIYAIEKLHSLGARVIACSDSDGYIVDEQGINLELLKEIKEVNRKRISDYADRISHARYVEDGNLWDVPCQLAVPCATQNELNGRDARKLVNNACIAVAEGANMPCTPDAARIFLDAGVAYGVGKAANAGGVATSALEMQQNATRDSWTFEHTENRLDQIMVDIHRTCHQTAEEYGFPGNYVHGANIAGFVRVADAMLALGLI
jgi:glutamate dehydrogenase (NADP+)